MSADQLNLVICAEQVAKAAAALITDRQSELMKWVELAGKIATPIGGVVAGIWALRIYHRAKRREAAQWMHEIFQRFQLGEEFTHAKRIFDFQYSDEVEPILAALVSGGNSALRDSEITAVDGIDRLLNYLEHVVYLADNGHVKWRDSLAYFQYWFDLLSEAERGALRRYLVRFGYERLAKITHASQGEFLLLYGTLRSGERAYTDLGLEAALERVGTRRIKGTLYDLGEYPGLVAGPGNVEAELFKVLDSSVLVRLDTFEEYDHTNLKDSLYRRRTMRLPATSNWICKAMARNRYIDAWIYIYNGSTEGKPQIHEKSWQEYKLKRQADL